MALGEAFLRSPTDADHLLFVKIATGLGLGYVTDGVVQRGALGCFGDIGTSSSRITTTFCAGAATTAASRQSRAAAHWRRS